MPTNVVMLPLHVHIIHVLLHFRSNNPQLLIAPPLFNPLTVNQKVRWQVYCAKLTKYLLVHRFVAVSLSTIPVLSKISVDLIGCPTDV